jgi:signal transduction histidine kinase
MEQASRRMGTLIDDLLMYSHVSRGVTQLENIDLNQNIKNVLEDLELEILEKQARIKVDPLPVIKGHRRQLQQLFQNLISNAIKYNKASVTPQVYITAQVVKGRDTSLLLQAEKGNRMYHLIEVRDNGIGFEQADADRIFNVFTRLHGNAEYKGTGVGLAIARKVAENHNGYLWAESVPDSGATFKVLLPAE